MESESGHASMPPLETSIGVLSAAISKLEATPMPATIDGVQRQTLAYLGPEMPFTKRLVMANLWLFKPLVARKLAASPGSNAAIRSTTALTMIESGIKENVLPTRARAVVNFRLLPGDTSDKVIAHVSEVVNDARVKVSRLGNSNNEPTPVSRTDAFGYEVIERTTREVFTGVSVAPVLCVGGVDSKHCLRLTHSSYRFSPLRLKPEDLKRLHGINERTSVKDYAASVKFYYQLIKNSGQ